MPHKFLVEACKKARIELPEPGAVRLRHRLPAAQCRRCAGASKSASSRSCSPKARPCSAGARCRPTTRCSARRRRRASRSCARCSSGAIRRSPTSMAFERKLYVIRKRAYSEIRTSTLEGAAYWYVASLSHKTLVYKGMLMTEQVAPVFPGPDAIRRWRRRWRWCTRASARTRSRAGSARIRIATSRTTARSTRCAATSTGCTRARRCSSPKLFGDDIEKILPIINPNGSRLGDVRQHARAAGAGGPLAAARDDDDDSRAVVEPRDAWATRSARSTSITRA